MSGRKPTSARERFDEKCKPVENGCVEWTGGTTTNGYGLFYADGQMRPAHRWALEQANGAKLDGKMDCCHTCDNRLCVNVAHLFAGTRKDNMADCKAKGRTDRTQKPKGETHGRATLVNTTVLRMRAAALAGESILKISRDFDSAYMTVYRVVNRQTWKHI